MKVEGSIETPIRRSQIDSPSNERRKAGGDVPYTIYTEEHDLHRESVRRFVEKEIVPHRERWEEQGAVDPSLFTAAGAAGILGVAAPEEHGGGGVSDFRYNAVLSEELSAADGLSAG